MKITTLNYLPEEDITDFVNSSAHDWIVNLWNNSGRSRFIVLEEKFFSTLIIHPEIVQGVKFSWIIVQHTSMFFPFMGLTIINESQLKAYNVSPIKYQS